jgi:ubiquinone/menaquinone biosynthesis C-methylase UbiE
VLPISPSASLLQASRDNNGCWRVFYPSVIFASTVADVACGNGAMSYWLSEIYTDATFTLLDLNPLLLADAKEINREKAGFSYLEADIYNMHKIPDNTFDLVVSLQTLLSLEHPEQAIKELVRITASPGRIYLSSLFNAAHEVDVYSKVYDWTRKSTYEGGYYLYNTYSLKTVGSWLESFNCTYSYYPFEIDIDLSYSGKGLGTYTVTTDQGDRRQMSAGMALNWGILEIQKL